MYPSYLNLSKKELTKRVEKALSLLNPCHVCPRQCGGNRLNNEKKGFCGLGRKAKVSSYHAHFGEELCLRGRYGSGTIFLTSCNLACVFCQNYDISQLDQGSEVTPEKLAKMMIVLQKFGCHNINFVSPTSPVPQILEALVMAIEQGLKIPLVYNTNAYDSVETLKLLDGIVDIYMPDTKYSDDKIALKYSQAPRYFATMKLAIMEMHHQVGDLEIVDGLARRGLLIRHLVLPNGLAGSEKIFKFLAQDISKDSFVNIMDQYRPCFKAFRHPELNRGITEEEYKNAVSLARKYGLHRFDE